MARSGGPRSAPTTSDGRPHWLLSLLTAPLTGTPDTVLPLCLRAATSKSDYSDEDAECLTPGRLGERSVTDKRPRAPPPSPRDAAADPAPIR
jgi:hypothetical protein